MEGVLVVGTSGGAQNIVCINPGMTTVGFLHVELQADRLSSILACKAVNVSGGMHLRERTFDCKHIYSCIVQFLKDEHDAFTAADIIVVDMPNPTRHPWAMSGMPLAIMLQERFGSKCVSFDPRCALWEMFALSRCVDYKRMRQVKQIVATHCKRWAEVGVPGAPSAKRRIPKSSKSHDLCDAVLLLLAWTWHDARLVL
jgi:hypothetical protein